MPLMNSKGRKVLGPLYREEASGRSNVDEFVHPLRYPTLRLNAPILDVPFLVILVNHFVPQGSIKGIWRVSTLRPPLVLR